MPHGIPRAKRRLSPAIAASAFLLLSGRHAAHGFGFGLFQHGGRGVSQAGALVARADDPSAVRYDLAALTDVDGLAVQAGLDFAVTDVEHASALTGRADAEHEIQFTPAVYLVWRPAPGARWALGLALDSPLWTLDEWPAAFASGRSSRKSKAAF